MTQQPGELGAEPTEDVGSTSESVEVDQQTAAETTGVQEVYRGHVPDAGESRPARQTSLWLGIGVAAVLILIVLGLLGVLMRPVEPLPNVTESPTLTATGTGVPSPPWDGAVAPVKAESVDASCFEPGSGSGNPKPESAPGNVLDDDVKTAWVCKGKVVGQTLRFLLPAGTRLAEVGVLNGDMRPGDATTRSQPGYTKYARVLEVKWVLPSGDFFTQEMSDNTYVPQRLRIPVTVVDGPIIMQIVRVSEDGEREIVIPEVTFAKAVG